MKENLKVRFYDRSLSEMKIKVFHIDSNSEKQHAIFNSTQTLNDISFSNCNITKLSI